MRRYFYILLLILNNPLACSQANNQQIDEEIIELDIELNIVDSIIGTCSSIEANGDFLFATFDGLSKQTLQAFNFSTPDNPMIGRFVRDSHRIRDLIIINKYLVLVEGIYGALFIENIEENFTAVGELKINNDPDPALESSKFLFDIEHFNNRYYCACGEYGIFLYDLRTSDRNEFIRFSLYDSIIIEGTISELAKGDNYIAAASWDLKKIYFINLENEIIGEINDLPAIAAMEIKDNKIFIAAEHGGVLIYNLDNIDNPELIKEINDIDAFDLVIYNNYIIVAADIDGVYLFDLNGNFIEKNSNSAPAEKVAVGDNILYVSYAGMLPKGFVWFIDIVGLK